MRASRVVPARDPSTPILCDIVQGDAWGRRSVRSTAVASQCSRPCAVSAADRSRRSGRGHARPVVDQLDDYVLPRLARIDAPLLAVINLVRGQLAKRRARARAVSFSVNGFGVVLMMEALTGLADPTPAGSGLGAGDGVPTSARRALGSVFDEQTVSDLAQQAQVNLLDRLSTLMYEERSRFDRALDRLRIPDDQASVLTAAMAAAALAPRSLPG